MSNKKVKYLTFLIMLISSLYLLSGCKWKHTFKNSGSYQEIIILSPNGRKEDRLRIERKLTEKDKKRIEKVLEKDRQRHLK